MKNLNELEITIRQEIPSDYQVVFDIVEKAFKIKEYADGDEQFLVEKLKTSDSFIPELSLVALYKNQLVGHILFTR